MVVATSRVQELFDDARFMHRSALDGWMLLMSAMLPTRLGAPPNVPPTR